MSTLRTGPQVGVIRCMCVACKLQQEAAVMCRVLQFWRQYQYTLDTYCPSASTLSFVCTAPCAARPEPEHRQNTFIFCKCPSFFLLKLPICINDKIIFIYFGSLLKQHLIQWSPPTLKCPIKTVNIWLLMYIQHRSQNRETLVMCSMWLEPVHETKVKQ